MKEHKEFKEQVETLKEENDELREEIASLENSNEELENDNEKLKAEIDELKAMVAKADKHYDYQKTAWDKEQVFLRDENRTLQKECDKLKADKEVSTARFLDEQQMRAVGLCLISQALGFDYHGDNDEIFKAIKKLQMEVKLLISADKLADDEIASLKASQKQKNRIIKKLKDNVDTLKKTIDEINLED